MTPEQNLSEVVRDWSEVFMHRSMRDFKRFMDETGLSFSQIGVLMRLLHGNGSGVSDIGGELGIPNAAASQAVERLVQLGLVTRVEDPSDRRARQLSLTPRGREIIERGIQVRSRWVGELTDNLTSQQQEMIISSLKLLTEAAQKTSA